MNTIIIKNTITIVLIVSLVLSLGGCGSENHKKDGNGLKLSTIYGAALGGALIGGIIGHQSDETSEGVTLGAVVLGVGEFLRQTDELARKQRKHEDGDGDVEKVIVEIHNENGSVTPVELTRDGTSYIGPKGEYYTDLPTEEQLKPVYGL